jgi:hypothetical protein
VAGRGGFGQAIAFGKAQPEFLLQAFGHGLWHGGTAA